MADPDKDIMKRKSSINLPTPEAFRDAMTARWMHLGNVSSPRLEALWLTMGRIFNEAAANQDDTWRILKPPTGSGKSQGLCVYSAMVLKTSCPLGILVVTRTIEQANEIVETIRSMIPEGLHNKVRANHSASPLKWFEIASSQVLVVTHAAYGLSLASKGRPTDWEGGPRRLTIIDEALAGIVEEHRVTLDDVKDVLRCLDVTHKITFPKQVAAI